MSAQSSSKTEDKTPKSPIKWIILTLVILFILGYLFVFRPVIKNNCLKLLAQQERTTLFGKRISVNPFNELESRAYKDCLKQLDPIEAIIRFRR